MLARSDHQEFAEELHKLGYVGVYKRRTGACRDGCAVFWRETRFALLEEQSIEFRDFKLQDNVAQICVLESKLCDDSVGFRGPGFKNLGFEKLWLRNRVVVGNVHMMFNPLRGEVKLGQARVFLENLHMMSGKWGNVPVAIAGDFNCTPSSPLYRFLSSSHLDLTGLNRRNISGQEEPLETEKRSRHKFSNRTFRGSDSETVRKRSSVPQGWDQFEVMAATGERNLFALQHKLKLRSAYSEIEGKAGSRDARGEPFVTSFQKSSSSTVDYIWHTDNLRPVRVLDTLPISVLQRDKGLPAQQRASDHLALACEFSIVPNRDTQEVISNS